MWQTMDCINATDSITVRPQPGNRKEQHPTSMAERIVRSPLIVGIDYVQMQLCPSLGMTWSCFAQMPKVIGIGTGVQW